MARFYKYLNEQHARREIERCKNTLAAIHGRVKQHSSETGVLLLDIISLEVYAKLADDEMASSKSRRCLNNLLQGFRADAKRCADLQRRMECAISWLVRNGYSQ